MSTAVVGEHLAPRIRGWVRVLVMLLLGGALVLSGAQPASAHAQLVSTTPEDRAVLEQAPDIAEFVFSEPVQLINGSVRLFPDGGEPVALEVATANATLTATLPQGLADGSYALSYRVISADGHPIAGALSFSIGAPSATGNAEVTTATPSATQVALAALTAAQYVGLLSLLGLVTFGTLILRSTQPPTGAARRSIALSAGTAILSTVLLVPVAALNVLGGHLGQSFDGSWWQTGVTWPPIVAAGLVTLGAGLALLGSRSHSTPRSTRVATIIAAVAAACAPTLVGHSQLVEPRPLIMAADLGHLLSGAFWTGGILGLLIFLAEARPKGTETETSPQVAVEAVRRFSRYAIWSVLILGMSGILLGVMIVGTIDKLVTTAYGLTLLLKLSMVVAVIVIAIWNRRRLLPAIQAQPTVRGRWVTLRRLLAYEATLLIAILVVTGFLSNQSPNHDNHQATGATTATRTELTGEGQGMEAKGTVTPLLTGMNELVFTVRYDGKTVTPEDVAVRATLPEQDLGPIEVVPVLDPDTGEYRTAIDLPVAGEWQLQILARISTFEQPIVAIPVTVR